MYLQKKARVRYALRILTIKQVNLHTNSLKKVNTFLVQTILIIGLMQVLANGVQRMV